MRDPAAVDACAEAGVGERMTLNLGAKTETKFDIGDPIEGIDGYVKALTDGEFVNTGPMETGTENYFGRTALL